MKRGINRLLAFVLSFAMVLTGFTFLGGAAVVNADEGDKPEIMITGINSANTQPAKGGTYSWGIIGADDTVDYSAISDSDFGMQVKVGDGEWTDTTDAVASFKLEENDNYDGLVNATVPDNTDPVAKQWRFTYSGGIVDWGGSEADCPAITQEAGEATSNKPVNVVISRDEEKYDTEDIEWQPAAGGKYYWVALDSEYGSLEGRIEASDFKVQTKTADTDWADTEIGTIVIENISDEYGMGAAEIRLDVPDNTDTYDKYWRIAYVYTEPETQYESCGSEFYAQAALTDKSELEAAVTAAQEAKKDVKISEDGEDVDTTDKYVTPAESQALEDAIASAQSVLADATVSQTNIDKEVEALNAAVETYEAAKKDGLKPVDITEWNENCFTYSDDNTTVTGLSEAGEALVANNPDMVIPNEHDGVKITAIGARAFTGKEIESVVYPEGITSIGINAFQTCNNLESVVIPASVTTLGGGAFVNCKGLKSIIFEEGIHLNKDEVPAIASGCDNLETLVIPEGIKSIAASAFQRAYSLKNVAFPSTLEVINRNAFSGNRFTEVDLSGTSVKKIESGAFSCTGNNGSDGTAFLLKSVKLNEGLESIAQNAFKGSAVETVNLPSTVVTLNATAFGQASDSGIPETGKTLVIPAEGVDYPSTVARNVPGDKNGHVFQFTVQFDAGEGAEAVEAGKTNSAGKIAAVPASTKEGFIFKGWFTAAEGGDQVTSETVFTEDTTVFAQWEDKAVTDAAALVDALPADITTGDKEAVEAARAAYDDLTDDQKAVFPAETLSKLEKAEAAYAKADAEEAKAAAAEAAEAAAQATPGTQDAVDKAAAAKEAADTALEKAQAAQAAAEKAYGADSEEAQAAAAAVETAQTAVTDAETAQAAAETAKANVDAAQQAKADAEEAKAAAAEAAEAAANAKPGTQDAVDKAAAAKAAAEKAAEKAAAAQAAAEKAYGADSEEAKAAAQAAEEAKTAATEAAAAEKTAEKAKADADKKAADEKAAADKKAAEEKAAAEKEAKAKKVKTVTVNVKTVNAKAIDKAVTKAGGSKKYVTKIVLGKKVKKISASAFKSYKKVTTLEVKTKKLTKKSVKKALKGSKVKTVKVKVSKKAKANKKIIKKYKKIFTKKVAGKKVKVK